MNNTIIHTPLVSLADGTYSNTVRAGDRAHLSGLLCTDPASGNLQGGLTTQAIPVKAPE